MGFLTHVSDGASDVIIRSQFEVCWDNLGKLFSFLPCGTIEIFFSIFGESLRNRIIASALGTLP